MLVSSMIVTGSIEAVSFSIVLSFFEDQVAVA